MLWLTPEQIDKCWLQIDEQTQAGQLGVAAKRATSPNDGGRYLICVYTLDYADRRDVARVLGALRKLGHDGQLLYKEDAATHAGIYGKGASLYKAAPGSDGFSQLRRPIDNPLERPS